MSDESQYLLLLQVPQLGLTKELHATCSAYGTITALSVLDDYPAEPFTSTYLLKYENINSARYLFISCYFFAMNSNSDRNGQSIN